VADPGFALAYAGLADAYNTLGSMRFMAPGEAFTRAKLAATQGLAIDDSLGELHSSLANVLRQLDWDWEASEREFLRAIALNPGFAIGHDRYALLLSLLGRHDEAVASVRRALELDPLSLIIHTAVGDVHFYARRFEEALPYYRWCQQMDPTFRPGNTDLARSLDQVGAHDEALESFERGTREADGTVPPSTGLAIYQWRAGREAEARATMASVMDRPAGRYVAPFGIASFHAVAGETEAALDWLERAYAQHDASMTLLRVHPRLDQLRTEPRFRELLRKMRLDH